MRYIFGFGIVFVVYFTKSVLSAPVADDSLIITLPNGKIQGAAYKTLNYNKTYYGFRGIPYGKPPLGDLSFKSPQPAESWKDILNATGDSKSCITINYLSEPNQESEDCLYINVYIPTLHPSEKLPVMFWIYGGAFLDGSSDKNLYGPDFLMEKDIIMVSFNYRLGALGFISTGDRVLPGNLGLKDQNLALRWTRENIEYFGGDPEKVTIFGQSAGGASTGLHLVSKKSSGLFRAAIVESGCALNPWTIDSNPKKTAYLFADGIPNGNYGNDTQALKDFLKIQTVEDIVIANTKLKVLFGPTLEIDSEDAFITDSPYVLLENGDFNQVPIVIGVTSEESLSFLRDESQTFNVGLSYDLNPTSLIPADLFSNTSNITTVTQRIKEIYLNRNELFATNLAAVAEVYTDSFTRRSSLKHAELASSFVPVYFYEFSYYGRTSTIPFIDGVGKASHFAELPFLFNYLGMSNTTNTNDLLTQDRTVTLWTNFAKYLNPTPTKSELFTDILWPKLHKETSLYLNINNTLQIREHLKRNSYSN
ncbi:unnamed protein product [Ceutorhynchus assimilis]|uniref:Carboxylic ester hydrolase n=1 Tax=Ceutorhynchus assimilis TaxID=467358 RepID=A0A9N9MQE2_9CUCU|nr:unnamed protein product [Ceutorhynchus assimilis]